jgi:ATP-dependent Lon protease
MIPWDAEVLTFDESRFHGKVRLFPLPDFVMFPHVMQPLHIFEPRYLELLRHALDGDGLIAMSLPEEDGPQDPGAGPLRRIACLGKIVTHQRLDNGRYNLMLLGMRRIRIVQELPRSFQFREAEAQLLDDVYPTAGAAARDELQLNLCELFQQFLPDGFTGDQTVTELLTTEASLGALTDLVSFAAPLPTQFKYDMLAQCDVDLRAARLCRALAAQAEEEVPATETTEPRPRRRRFPPPFSAN